MSRARVIAVGFALLRTGYVDVIMNTFCWLWCDRNFDFAEAPFAVSIVVVSCTAPRFVPVSSNAFMINHIVVHKRKLTA